MELTLRRLYIEDMAFIEDLFHSQTRMFQMPKREDTNKYYIAAIKHRLQHDTEHTTLHLYGTFLEQKLIAMGGGFFGLKMPLWSLSYLHTRKEAHASYRLTTGKIVDTLIDYAESQGIYRFDYVTGMRSMLTYDPKNFPSRLTKISEKSKRYQYYTDAIIEKNTRPKYDYHWFHLGQQTLDIDMIVRVAELKEEYRQEVIKKILNSEGNKTLKTVSSMSFAEQ